MTFYYLHNNSFYGHPSIISTPILQKHEKKKKKMAKVSKQLLAYIDTFYNTNTAPY